MVWTTRHLVVSTHRWVALALGTWFSLLGLTGAGMVWHAELDAWLNPMWFTPRPACGERMGEPIGTALEVFGRVPERELAAMVTAPQVPGAAYTVWERAAVGATRRQHFVDVGCGTYLGMREWGAPRLDRAHAVPAIYELHRSLLAGEKGHLLVGIGGLVLLGVALTGLVVAWPGKSSGASWARALTIKRQASTSRRFYDLHRAVGLWVLPFLLLMSVTGAYLCFPKQGRALVSSLLPTHDGGLVRVTTSAAAVGSDRAATADALASTAQAMWPDAQWTRIQLPAPGRSYFEVRLLQRGEPRTDTGDTRVRLNEQAQVLAVRDALNAPAGETLLGWLFPLHSAEALGLAGRGAWTLFGMTPALLFGTGAWLWWRRRRSAGAMRTGAFERRIRLAAPTDSSTKGVCR